MGEKLFGKESKMIHFRSVLLLLSVLFVWIDQFSSYLHQHSVNLQPTLQHPVKFAPVNLATSWSTSRNLFQEASAQQKPLFIRSHSNFQVFLKPSTRPSGSRIQQNDPPAPIAQNESKSSGFLHKIKHFFSSRYEALNDLDDHQRLRWSMIYLNIILLTLSLSVRSVLYLLLSPKTYRDFYSVVYGKIAGRILQNLVSTIKLWVHGVASILIGLTFIRDLSRKEIDDIKKIQIEEKRTVDSSHEDMYFDVVETMLKQLDDPNVSKKKKQQIKEDLDALDPNEKIRKFVLHGGERPDISEETAPYTEEELEEERKEKERKQREKEMEMRRAGKSVPSRTSKKSTSTTTKTTNRASPSAPPPPPPQPMPPQFPPQPSPPVLQLSEDDRIQQRIVQGNELYDQIDRNLMVFQIKPNLRTLIIDNLKKKLPELAKDPETYIEKIARLQRVVDDRKFWLLHAERLEEQLERQRK